MPHARIIARLDAAEVLTPQEADDFDFECGRARAEAIDGLLLAVVGERGWSLLDDLVLERVSVEHEGPTRARIVIDGKAVTPWWDDRVAIRDGRRFWSYEPESG